MKITKAIPVIAMILAGYFCVEIGELIGYTTVDQVSCKITGKDIHDLIYANRINDDSSWFWSL